MKNEAKATEAVEVSQGREADATTEPGTTKHPVRQGWALANDWESYEPPTELDAMRAQHDFDRELLTAVVESLTLPSPATVADEQAWHDTIMRRISAVRIVVQDALDSEFSSGATTLRKLAAGSPVTYKTVRGGES